MDGYPWTDGQERGTPPVGHVSPVDRQSRSVARVDT
jgi:hypothetical protein